MYSRKNCHPDGPGEWTSDDGEYAFTRGHRAGYAADWWTVTHRATISSRSGELGTARTLTAAMRMAWRHSVTPVGQWTEHDPAVCGQCAEAQYR